MSSITILRLGVWLLELYSVLTSALQIDKNRAVAAGGSYGGYAVKCVLRRILGTMTNDVPSWIQGHPDFGFGFKALVCHDGVCGNG